MGTIIYRLRSSTIEQARPKGQVASSSLVEGSNHVLIFSSPNGRAPGFDPEVWKHSGFESWGESQI